MLAATDWLQSFGLSALYERNVREVRKGLSTTAPPLA